MKELERSKLEDKLEHMLEHRPTKDELVQQHILADSAADPSLIAKQIELEHHQLADKLDKALHRRPSAEDLVKKHILTGILFLFINRVVIFVEDEIPGQ